MMLPILTVLLHMQNAGPLPTVNSPGRELAADSICPASIITNEIAERPGGFEFLEIEPVRNAYFLKKVSFFFGDPVNASRIAPASFTRLGGSKVTSYTFGENDDAGIWVECRYRDSTDRFVLSKKTNSLEGCVVTQSGKDGTVVSLKCRQ